MTRLQKSYKTFTKKTQAQLHVCVIAMAKALAKLLDSVQGGLAVLALSQSTELMKSSEVHWLGPLENNTQT